MPIKCYRGLQETNLIPTKVVREGVRNVAFRLGLENQAAFQHLEVYGDRGKLSSDEERATQSYPWERETAGATVDLLVTEW